MAAPLHPPIVCFSLAMIYNHTKLDLNWSRLTPMRYFFSSNHFVDSIYGQMYLLTTSAGFIAGQGNILQYVKWRCV